MSYWGAQVIVNLFGAIPFIGPDLSLWIRGDYVVSDATLNRFFAFHVIAIPLVLLGLVVAHLIALHEVGSNNPDGVEVKENLGPDGHGVDTIPSHPYYTTKDIFGVACFLFIFSAVVFYAPEFGGYFLEYNNFIPADPLKTPAHIAPVWYFTPFYSILRATTSQFMYALIIGVLAYGALIALKTQLPSRQKQAAMGISVVVAILMLVFDAKFWGVVLFGGFLEPLDGFDGVFGGAVAAFAEEGELELGGGEALFGGFAVPAGGIGGVFGEFAAEEDAEVVLAGDVALLGCFAEPLGGLGDVFGDAGAVQED
jgi:ubiquinol-cytochrome c reductase cytochrome b subunit